MGLKFPQSARLKKPKEFLEVKKAGKKIHANGFTVCFLDGAKRRLGLTIPKHAGNAATRARVKRVLREFFRQHKERFPVADTVFIASSKFEDITNEEIRCMIQASLEKVNARRKK